jgi:hypothetical protein
MNWRNIFIAIIVIVIASSLIFIFFFNDRKDSITNTGNDDAFSFDSDSRSVDSGTGTSTDRDPGSQLVEFGEDGQVNVPKIRILSPKDISGYGLFDDSGTTTIRYIDTESGNIYETSSKSLENKRITNTTILQTIDSLWMSRDKLIIRYIDENKDIQTFSAEIKINDNEGEGAELGTIIGSFMEKNIEQIDVRGETIFSLIENVSNSLGIISNSDLSSDETVLNTPLKEIRVLWAGKNTIAINTKPSASSLGYLFYLNTISGSFDPVLSGINGLNTSVSEDHEGILYNKSEPLGVSLWFFDLDNQEERKLSKSTIVDKCTWIKSEEKIVYCAISDRISFRNLPDEWYKGNISFSDSIWKINLETGEEEMIADIREEVGLVVDVIDISINETNDYLVFVNKSNMTLWGVDLTKIQDGI